MYVAFNQFNSDQLHVFKEMNLKAIEVCPPSIRPVVSRRMSQFGLIPEKSFLKNRVYAPKKSKTARMYFGLVFLINPIFIQISFLRKYRFTAIKIALRLDSSVLKLAANFCQIVIFPSDFVKAVKSKSPKRKQILEIRWHHTGVNSNRPKKQLDYPVNYTEEPGAWEVVFAKEYSKFDGFITYSNVARDSFISMGISPDKICSVPIRSRVVHLNQTESFAPRERRILYVGRDELYKGLDIAMAVSLSTSIPITVVGTFSSDVATWVKTFSNANYLGNIDHESLLGLMQTIEIYLAPGIESFGYSCVEALSSRMKVVGTDMTGALDWYRGMPNCFLAADLDVSSLSSEVKRAVKLELPAEINFEEIDPKPYWEKAGKLFVS